MAYQPRIVEPPVHDPPLTDYPSGQRFSQAWTEYNQSVADRLTALHAGTVDGSEANPGDVGETLTTSGSGAVTLTSGAIATVATLNLTAGDWDVQGNVVFSSAGGTARAYYGVGTGGLDTQLTATFSTATSNQQMNTAVKRYNVTGATSVPIVAQAAFTGGTVTATATARARRMR